METQANYTANPLVEAMSINTGLGYVCFDIETGHAAEEDVKAIMETWRPRGNVKDEEKIAAQRAAAEIEAKEKSALSDRAPVACIAIVTDKENIIFSSIQSPNAPSMISGVNVPVVNCANERDMLLKLREWLDARVSPESVLVGFNSKGFDLPKMRNAYIRHKLKLPKCFMISACEHFDVMKEFVYGFSPEFRNEQYAKLAVVQNRFGLPEYKSEISGADVPNLVAKGEAEIVLKYCFLDTWTTALAFLHMTGEMPDAQ